MLDESELTAWYRRLNLTDRARTQIDQIRSSEPARRVRGGRSNVSGLYPSRKMRVSIQFESHRVELVAIYEMEHDPLTLEFYDQPPPMMLDYNSANGRRMAVRHTPDFFVLRQDSAGWEEWKTEEDLHRLTEHNPNRYRQEAGSWRCPPGEAYAAQLGLSYQVRSSKEIHWRLQRHILFIHDDLHTDPDTIPAATRERLLAYVRAAPVLSLRDLIEQTAEFATKDDIYLLIAARRLYVDLYAAPLAEPATVRVFQDREAAIRYGGSSGGRIGEPPLLAPLQTFCAGAALTWDDRIWKVVNVGSTRISLLGEEGSVVELPQDAVESLVREGRMAQPLVCADRRQKLSNHLLHASEDDLKVANRRADIVRRYVAGEPAIDGEQISPRTLRRWISRYRAAESQWGAGYIGLLPRTSHRGNSTRRLPEESLRLMKEVIEGEYESVRQKSRIACWAILKDTCKRQAIPAPSYTSFCVADPHRRPGIRAFLMSTVTAPGNSLLAEPPSVRLEYFKDFAVAHPLLVEAKDRLLEAITESAPNSLIILSGPTGVGKTTLLTKIQQLLSAPPFQMGPPDPALLAVVTVEATPPESRSFSWRSPFKRLLQAMNEPLVDYKRRMNPVDRTAQTMSSFPNDRGVTADYHYAVEQALRYRRPRAVLIDEAQHLFALASGRSLEDQLNVLKSLANRSNTVHVLCGTYELLRVRNLSGQLSRRSIDIHFPRYDVAQAADRQTFAKILQTFGEQMPLPEPPDLIRYWEYLYERSIGGVGILKDWLVKGLSVAIRQSAPTLTLEHPEKHALSVAQCDRLIEEAARGESGFREDADALGRLRLRLGFPEPSRPTETPAAAAADRPRQQHPGERYPKRDAVGGGEPLASSPTP